MKQDKGWGTLTFPGGGEEWGVGSGGVGGRGNPSLKHWAGKSGSAYIFVLHCGPEPVQK